MENLIKQVPVETWVVIASVVLTLVVNAAHQRGYKIPLLESVLAVVNRTPAKADERKEAKDVVDLDALVDGVLKKLKDKEVK